MIWEIKKECEKNIIDTHRKQVDLFNEWERKSNLYDYRYVSRKLESYNIARDWLNDLKSKIKLAEMWK